MHVHQKFYDITCRQNVAGLDESVIDCQSTAIKHRLKPLRWNKLKVLRKDLVQYMMYCQLYTTKFHKYWDELLRFSFPSMLAEPLFLWYRDKVPPAEILQWTYNSSISWLTLAKKYPIVSVSTCSCSKYRPPKPKRSRVHARTRRVYGALGKFPGATNSMDVVL